MAGGVSYNLVTSDTGTPDHDIMTGWRTNDVFYAGSGNDYLTGGGGRDHFYGDAGDDLLFGDWGSDFLYGGAGNDRLFGGNGNDRIYGGDDADQLEGGSGKDVLRGDSGDDVLSGGADNDRLIGGQGDDRLTGGDGDDVMKGQAGGDVYVFSCLGAGNDTIIDNGTAAFMQWGWLTWNMDEVAFTDFNSLDEARHHVDISVAGNDLILTYGHASSIGATGRISVQDHFLGARTALEQINFGVGGFEAIYHIAYLSGDDYTYSVHGGIDAGGNDVVLGTAGSDQIYGGLGSDIMLGLGGADHFMFHDEGDNRGGIDLILDFDLAGDKLDFTDIKGFAFSDLTITENAYGNAVIASIYGSIELSGIATIDIDASIFEFA